MVRRRYCIADALGVRVGSALGAGDAARSGRSRRRIVEDEAGGTKGLRMVTEEAMRAVEVENVTEACCVYDPGVSAAAAIAYLGRNRRGIRRWRS